MAIIALLVMLTPISKCNSLPPTPEEPTQEVLIAAHND